MRLKIISDGETTQVVDAETGEPVQGVIGVSWEARLREGEHRINVQFESIEAAIEARVTQLVDAADLRRLLDQVKQIVPALKGHVDAERHEEWVVRQHEMEMIYA